MKEQLLCLEIDYKQKQQNVGSPPVSSDRIHFAHIEKT